MVVVVCCRIVASIWGRESGSAKTHASSTISFQQGPCRILLLCVSRLSLNFLAGRRLVSIRYASAWSKGGNGRKKGKGAALAGRSRGEEGGGKLRCPCCWREREERKKGRKNALFASYHRNTTIGRRRDVGKRGECGILGGGVPVELYYEWGLTGVTLQVVRLFAPHKLVSNT